MQTPDVVVFDLGKVLVDFDYSLAIGKIAARCPEGHCDLFKLIDRSPLLFRYETGLLSTAGFFDETRAASGFAGSFEEFGGMFADIFSEIPEMIAAQQQLRSAGIPTYIFSNTNELAIGHIRRCFPFFSGFSGYVFSYEEKSMKPDQAIYSVVERVTGKNGKAILYIDDRFENIETGDQMGWQTIHHVDPATTISKMRSLGLPVKTATGKRQCAGAELTEPSR